MRVTSACLLALAALLLAGSGESAHADDLADITSSVNYEVRAEEGDVLVTWDVSFTNNDPDFFIFALPVPVLAGATDVTASSAAGAPLSTSAEPTEIDLIDFQFVSFDRNVFFGSVYDFTLSYVVPEARQSGLIVTPFYVFLPLLAFGDEATVTTTAPDSSPWLSTLEPVDCERADEALACSGSDGVYFAGNLEVRQPNATQTDSFDLSIGGNEVTVSIEYFQGEDAAAAHQREVIEATLPLIADAYGFPYPGAPSIAVVHSGRQSVLGYEGLAECTSGRCEILILPGARDYTLVHELAHLWSGVFAARWLSEGFADWVGTQVVDQAPEGLLTGDLTPTSPATVPLQLDEWGDAEPLIGAPPEQRASALAGYDYSLRFVRTLADEMGAETLREVNRTLAESGEPADSRRYMDVLEDASGRDLDSLFLLWVFPESTRPLVEERREARDRFAEIESRLIDEGVSGEPLDLAREAILDWRFAGAQSEMDAVEANVGRALELQDELGGLKDDADPLGLAVPESIAAAQSEMDAVEANVGRALELQDELGGLKDDADPLGLAVPESIDAAISGWDFGAADDLIESAREAMGAYGVARERLNEPRNLWQRFGLLGDDPDGELAKAREAFEEGRFERSRERSAAAIGIVDDASRSAMLRLLVVAGIFSALALAIGAAYWTAILRRRLAEP